MHRGTHIKGRPMNEIKVRLNSFSLSTFNETYYYPHTMPPSIHCPFFLHGPFGDLLSSG